MSTPTSGNGRSTSDITHTSSPAPQHDAAAIDLRASNDPAQGHASKPPSTNLVLPRSPLIGRDHEIATLQELLLQEQVGLLTLTGPGGIGKTRLAMQVATTLLDHFVDGIYFVSLAPIGDADLVLVAIAETLGIREAGERPLLESLQAYLQHRQMLLVLDNFEQVVAAAPAVARLLAQCSRLKILVTSRATLHLYGEQEFPVPPLALPDPKRLNATGVELAPTLAQIASVTLFVQRAMAVKPDFALNASNAAVVAEICIGVDGLPLAIELAAAKIKLFSPPALQARLQQRLMLLTGGAHDMPARQRTLRDEIAWSYDLLAAGDQMLFRRLAVFMGGFTLEAAQAVCNATGDLGIDVLDGVASLLDQNLLKQAEQARRGRMSGVEARFYLLETIREYALEQLAASGEDEAIRCWHACVFLALAEENIAALEELAIERDNWRTALAWSLANTNTTEIALRLATALRGFWSVNGYWNEGRRWAEAALALTTAADYTEARAAALIDTGYFAVMQGDQLVAHARLEEGLTRARELDTKKLISRAIVYLAFIAHIQHDHTLALALLGEALTVQRELGDKLGIAQTLIFLGNVERDEHNFAGAQALYEEGLALFRELGDEWAIADTLTYVGQSAHAQGDYTQARDLFKESLARWRVIGTLQWKGVNDCLNGLASICALHHQFEEAAHLFAAAEALHELRRGSLPLPSHPSAEDKYTGLRTELGEAAFAAAWAAGRALSAEEAVDYAVALPAISAPAPDPMHSPVTHPAGLTTREVEVLRLLAQGLTYDQIAEQLIISPRTVNRHLTTIYTKLNVTSRHAATRFALDHRLV